MRRFIRKHQGKLFIVVILLAYGIVGNMEVHDAQCSWNGCGDARYIQSEE